MRQRKSVYVCVFRCRKLSYIITVTTVKVMGLGGGGVMNTFVLATI